MGPQRWKGVACLILALKSSSSLKVHQKHQNELKACKVARVLSRTLLEVMAAEGGGNLAITSSKYGVEPEN